MLYRMFCGASSVLLNIDALGYATDPEDTRCAAIARPNYLIHFCLSGKGYFHGRPVCAGEGFLMRPGACLAYEPSSDDPWEYVWVSSLDDRILPYFSRFEADGYGIFRFEGWEPLLALKKELLSSADAILDGDELLERFLRLINAQSQRSVRESRPSRVYLEFATRYIEANLHRTVTVEELTHRLGITQPYLYRLFKNHTSLSPKAYIDRAKLREAKRLLVETSLSVTEIADAVGYRDVHSFLRFFSTHESVTPSQYRDLPRR